MTHRRVFTQSLAGLVAAMLLFGCGESVLYGTSDNDLSKQECALKGNCTGCFKGEMGNLFSVSAAKSESCVHLSEWKMMAAESCQKAGLVLTSYQVREACQCEQGSKDFFSYVSYECCPATPPPPPVCIPDDPQTPLINEDSCGTGQVCIDEVCVSEPHQCVADDPQTPLVNEDSCVPNGTCIDGQCVSNPAQCTPGDASNCGPFNDCINGTCVPNIPSVCQLIVGGGPTSCKDSATWKAYGAGTCSAQGLEMADFGPFDSCGAGLWRQVNYVCCNFEQPGCTADDPKTPLINESSCGTGESCVDGKCLPDLVVCSGDDPATPLINESSCGAGESCVNGQCLPDPVVCSADDPATPLVNESSCSAGESCVNGQCVPEPLQCSSASDCGPFNDCVGGVCVPNVPAVCQLIVSGGPTSCKDSATWQVYGPSTCAAQGLELADFSPFESCGADSWRQVSYVCCNFK